MALSDLGLFGPESVTWRIHSDPVMGIAAMRAVLLQALHPVAMAGVVANSIFRHDAWGRLARTADYVAVVTYGTTEEAGQAAARVRNIHRRFTVTDPDTGRIRRVDEPELLLWVHNCEVESFLSTARRGGLRLSGAEADRYVAEQISAARLIGINPAEVEVARNVRELGEYFERMRPQLRATRQAYDALRFVFTPPMPTWVKVATPAMPGWISLATLGFSLLPAWARSLYSHLPGVPTTDLGATMSLRILRAALMAVPATVREGPHYRAAKDRVAQIPVRRLEVFPA